MDSTEVEMLIESIRSETCNASITPGRLATVLCELLTLLQEEEAGRILADRLLKEEILAGIASRIKALRDEILERLKEYEEVYYYEEDWDRLSESDQLLIIANTNRLVVLEGAAPMPEPEPESSCASYDDVTGIVTVADAEYDEVSGIVELNGTYDEATGFITLETAAPEGNSATYDDVTGIVNVEGSYEEETGIVSFDGSYDNGIITL